MITPVTLEARNLPLILCGSPRRGNSLRAAELAAGVIGAGWPRGAELLELRGRMLRPCIDCGACARAEGKFPAYPGALCPLDGGASRPASVNARVGKKEGTPEAGQRGTAAGPCAQGPAVIAPGLDSQSPPPPGEREGGNGIDECGEIFRRFLEAPFVLLTAPIYFYHLPAQLKGLLDRSQLFWQAGLQGVKAAPAAPRNAWCILLGAREQGEKLFEGSLLTLKYALEPFGLKLREPLTLYGLEQAGDLAGNPEAGQKILNYAARILEAERAFAAQGGD